TGALFLLVGMIYERRHTRLIAEFGGIAKPMPVYAALFGIVAMSSIGLPALNGFVGEFLILVGAFLASPGFAVAATAGVILPGACASGRAAARRPWGCWTSGCGRRRSWWGCSCRSSGSASIRIRS